MIKFVVMHTFFSKTYFKMRHVKSSSLIFILNLNLFIQR